MDMKTAEAQAAAMDRHEEYMRGLLDTFFEAPTVDKINQFKAAMNVHNIMYVAHHESYPEDVKDIPNVSLKLVE